MGLDGILRGGLIRALVAVVLRLHQLLFKHN